MLAMAGPLVRWGAELTPHALRVLTEIGKLPLRERGLHFGSRSSLIGYSGEEKKNLTVHH